MNSSNKLSEAFEKSQALKCRMLIVKSPKKFSTKAKKAVPFLGVITLHDILNALVGKIYHEPEKNFLPQTPRPN